MELRELTTARERDVFAECLAQARATRGYGFREKPGSRLGQMHLAYGKLYALFEGRSAAPEKMFAGFIAHDLSALPQSYPKPDLSRFAPESVIEGGELWSLSQGGGRIALLAAAAVSGIMQARAIVIYAAKAPFDLTSLYAPLKFVNACEPVEWPYAETVDGKSILVQPMILEGRPLREYIRSGFELLLQTSDRRRALSFDEILPLRETRRDAVEYRPANGTDRPEENGLSGANGASST